jgi:phosphoserine phosphatase
LSRISTDGLALFLDVGLTLTREAVQQVYADLLGFGDQFRDLESALRAGAMSAQEFGSILCGLLNAADANPKRLASLARHVQLRPGADALLRGARNVYLVSSGPDYFVRWLAKRYHIGASRVLCSQYVFDSRKGQFVGCVSIVGDLKKRFVQQEIGKYQVSIGVGDDPQRDAGFMGACDLSVGFGTAWEGLRTSDLNQVFDMVRTVRRFGTWCGRARRPRLEVDADEDSVDMFESFDDEDLGRSRDPESA